jgi:hypothetical protein
LIKGGALDTNRVGSAAGLLAFMEYLKEKGLMPARTADAWRSAAQAVLAVDGEGWAETDLRSLDLESQFQRFANIRGAKYTPASLRTYRQRFRDAVSMYLDYLSNPTGFKPRGSVTRRASGGSSSPKPDEKAVAETAAQWLSGVEKRDEPAGSAPKLLTYPFPMSGGELAYLQLPVHVSASDVERLCSFIRSIALDRFDG